MQKKKKRKNVQLFSVNFREDWSWLLFTFIYWLVPFLFTIFQLKRKLPPFAYTLYSPFLTTGASAYGEADEHDNSFDEGLEDGLLFRRWSYTPPCSEFSDRNTITCSIIQKTLLTSLMSLPTGKRKKWSIDLLLRSSWFCRISI